ncbi:MAG: hypothetical protein V4658_00030 [Bacteroidota bacterium]
MTPLFKKLNYKAQPEICVLNAPASFKTEQEAMSKVCKVNTDLKKLTSAEFMILFLTTQKELDQQVPLLVNKIEDNGVLWFCYPKGTSKKYSSEINRDNGWQILGDLGFEPVRAVAIDEDWSALRFRRAEHIKKMTRSFAMSKEGKKRVGKKV